MTENLAALESHDYRDEELRRYVAAYREHIAAQTDRMLKSLESIGQRFDRLGDTMIRGFAETCELLYQYVGEEDRPAADQILQRQRALIASLTPPTSR
jgi:hypothetical protein